MGERKQIAVWVNAETASLIDALRKEQGCSTGKLIELAIAGYATNERTSLGTSVDTSDSLVQILEWRDEVNSRLLALESRLEGIVAVGIVSEPQVDKVAVVADLTACVAIENAGAKTPVVEQGKRQAVEDDAKFDALVEKHGIKDGCYMGIRKTVSALRDAGYQATQERVGASLERVKGV